MDLQSETSFYTLYPLLKLGRDSLQPFGAVRRARLCGLQTHYENAPDDITIRKADDLFERAEDLGDEYGPIEAKATLDCATLDLEMDGSERPRRVVIRPPNSITVEFQQDVSRILAWLERGRFRVKRALSMGNKEWPERGQNPHQ